MQSGVMWLNRLGPIFLITLIYCTYALVSDYVSKYSTLFSAPSFVLEATISIKINSENMTLVLLGPDRFSHITPYFDMFFHAEFRLG